jgi:hypothetical protein
VFGAQQLARWSISESSLPRGSEVRFNIHKLWEAHRWQISIVVAILLMQGLLIIGLIIKRIRRTKAETASPEAHRGLRDCQGTLRRTHLEASHTHLDLKPRTVAFHKYGMMRQLGVKSTAELVHAAIKMGVIAG